MSLFSPTLRVAAGLMILAVLLASGCDAGPSPDQITVKVGLGGLGVGRVTGSAPASIHCPAVCEVTFEDAGAGGSFTLEAVAGVNSTFGGWTGCNSASGTTCTLSFSSSISDTTFNVTARFDTPFPPVEGFHTVYLRFPGTGTGRVTASDVGLGIDIDCTEDCRTTFEDDLDGGGNFSLEAVPAAGSVFGTWTGCSSASGTTCGLSYSPNALDTTFVVTATFNAAPAVRLIVGGAGTGGGNVTSRAIGLICDFPAVGNCATTFPAPAPGTVDLLATPAGGSEFAGWAGCTSVSGSTCTISYPASTVDLPITVRFDLSGSPTTKPINIYNGSGLTAVFVVNGHELGSVPSGQSPSVQIPTAIGTVVNAGADVGGEHSTGTCTVTESAWQGPGNPIVILNAQRAGGPPFFFTCTGF